MLLSDMTVFCFAPTRERPVTSLSRLTKVGVLLGLVFGGPCVALVLLALEVSEVAADPSAWSLNQAVTDLVTMVVIVAVSTMIGLIVGVSAALGAAATGRLARQTRLGVCLGAFATSGFLSWWPLNAITEHQTPLALALTLATATLTAWLMVGDQFFSSRSRGRDTKS